MTQEGEAGMRSKPLMESDLNKGRSEKREAKSSRRGGEGGKWAQRGGGTT
jgi:hypothetical protein